MDDDRASCSSFLRQSTSSLLRAGAVIALVLSPARPASAAPSARCAISVRVVRSVTVRDARTFVSPKVLAGTNAVVDAQGTPMRIRVELPEATRPDVVRVTVLADG